MNELNTVRLQLPDGTLVKIEGGTAENTAHFIANRYLRNALVTTEARPAVAPVLLNDNSEEEVLPLPVMNFAKPTSAGASSAAGEEVLELPSLF